jgi:PKD repeat protein
MIHNLPGMGPRSRNPGVSEVIGTLILVGVVLVGIAFAGTLLLSQPPPTKVPHLNAITSNQSKNIYILHKGGDPLISGEYQILVDGEDRTSSFVNNGDEPWSIGETLSYTSPTMPLKVVIVSTGSGGGASAVIMGSDLHPVLTVPLHPPNPPSVDWSSSPAFGNATISFQFTDSSTGGNITSYSWDFNDANTSAMQSLDHIFPCNTGDSCPYSINHSATDSGGTNWEATTWLNRSAVVTVYKNLTPTITFTQDRTSGPAGLLSVNFFATQYGGIKVDSWSWSFGDTGTSSSEDPSHTYTTQGIYTVTLTATNFTLGQTSVTENNLIQVTPPWYGCGWLYRKNITLNKTAVPADLTNFPVLIRYTDTDLSARAQGDGDDILFTRDDGTTKIPHELESYSGGALTGWVNVSSLSSAANTTIFMYYGNSGAASQQNPAGVWDSNYKAVWHFAPDLLDSTSNPNDGTNSGTANGAAMIANGRVYTSNDYVGVGSDASIANIFVGGGTYSAWIYPTGLGGSSEGRIGDKASSNACGASCSGWAFHVNTNNVLRFRQGFSGSGASGGNWNTSVNTITLSAWQHVAVTYNVNLSSDPTIYINGNPQTLKVTSSPAGYAATDSSKGMRIGNYAGGTGRTFIGTIDEIRVSKTIRSQNWVLTEYRNQNNPALFHYPMPQEAWTC